MRQPTSLSIVPSLLTPPIAPGRMRMQLVLAGYGVALALGLFTLLGAPFVLALPGIDAEGLLLHDYHEIIKTPMDLGTAKVCLD